MLKELPRINSDEYLFVVSWHSDGEYIYGRGCKADGSVAVIKLNIVPGLYGASSDPVMLQYALASHRIKKTKIKVRCNNFTPMDIFSGLEPTDATLVKVCTPKYKDAEALRYYTEKNGTMRPILAVTNYYSPQLQVYFELFVENYNKTGKYEHVRTTYRWFNADLKIDLTRPQPKIPMICFDIETVSSLATRVPTGEDKDDVLFSVSIHYAETDEMFCLVYVPIKKSSREIGEIIQKLDNYSGFKLRIFNSEKSLVKVALEMLYPKKLHYLVGYNSRFFDVKFMFLRSVFFDLRHPFIIDYGLSMGWNQIHLDLFQLCKSRYTLKRYSLNNVASEILNSSKENVDAVALRHTFNEILSTQQLKAHEDYKDPKIPSLYSMIIYNNQDTRLVTQLMEQTDMLVYAFKETDIKAFPINAFNVHASLMKHKVVMDCFLVGLSQKVFLGTYPHKNIQCLMNDQICEIDTMKNLDYKKPGKKETGYPGGINYCCESAYVANIKAYDYRIAYPYAIETMNLSSETATIVPGEVLFHCFDELDLGEWDFWEYRIHSSANPAHSSLYVHRMIVHGINFGGKIEECSKEYMEKHMDDLIICIYKGRRSVLSTIIETFNTHREDCKADKKTLGILIDDLNKIRLELILGKIGFKKIF